jgi:hypothetical protein
MAAQLDYLATLRQLDDLLPTKGRLAEVPRDAEVAPIRRTVDKAILLGAVCVAAWAAAATELALLLR